MTEIGDFLDSGSTAYVSVSILLFVGLWIGFFFLLNQGKDEARERRQQIAETVNQ